LTTTGSCVVGREASTPQREPDPFQRAAAAMVALAAAWAELHNAVKKMGEDKALRP
jgi:hypothetical protein